VLFLALDSDGEDLQIDSGNDHKSVYLAVAVGGVWRDAQTRSTRSNSWQSDGGTRSPPPAGPQRLSVAFTKARSPTTTSQIGEEWSEATRFDVSAEQAAVIASHPTLGRLYALPTALCGTQTPGSRKLLAIQASAN
jgi:hypothetical protein